MPMWSSGDVAYVERNRRYHQVSVDHVHGSQVSVTFMNGESQRMECEELHSQVDGVFLVCFLLFLWFVHCFSSIQLIFLTTRPRSYVVDI